MKENLILVGWALNGGVFCDNHAPDEGRGEPLFEEQVKRWKTPPVCNSCHKRLVE